MSVTLIDPLFQTEMPPVARCNGKLFGLTAFFIGLSCGAFWSGAISGLQQQEVTNAAAMLPMRSMARGRGSPAPIHSSAETLKKYGIGSSPIEKLAIAAIEATTCSEPERCARDVAALASKMPQDIQVRVSAMAEDVEVQAKDLAGITAPMGFFDPVGFAAEIPTGTLLFYREVELKHGRVGMLASLGILVGENFHPLFGGDIDAPAYKAFQQTPLQTFWPAVIALIAIPEIASILSFESPFDKFSGYAIKKGWSVKSGRLPGDLGYDPLGFKPSDPAALLEMQNKELNNGRLAMLAAAGMIAQELVTGEKILR